MRSLALLIISLLFPALAFSAAPPANVTVLQTAAQNGDAASQSSLGMMYHSGQSVPQSDTEALKWIGKAAAQGYAPAQANLGYMYYNGVGVPKNDIAAVSWYKRAAAQGYAPAITSLSTITGQQVSSPDNAALVNAAFKGDIETVKRLLDSGADPNSKIQNDRTALMGAVSHGHTDIAKLLLEKGADINAKDKYGGTIIKEAIQGGYTETVKFLLDKGASDLSYPPIIFAAFTGKTDIVKLMIERGTDVKSEEGAKALIVAAAQGHTAIVWLLLDKGVNIEAKDDNGNTALMQAARFGQADTVRLLLQRGAIRDEKDKNGRTALDLAQHLKESMMPFYQGKDEVIRLLQGKEDFSKTSPGSNNGQTYVPQKMVEVAENGYPMQQCDLARDYYYGLKDVPQSFSEAYYWYSVCDYNLGDAEIQNSDDFRKRAMTMQQEAMRPGADRKELEGKAMMVLMVNPALKKTTHIYLITLNKNLSQQDREKIAPRIEDWKKSHPPPAKPVVVAETNVSPTAPLGSQTFTKEDMDKLITLAEGGDREAQYKLSKCYKSPLLCDPPIIDVQRVLDHQAEQELAQQGQSVMHLSGLDLSKEYRPNVIVLLQKSADQKYMPAMFDLASEYTQTSRDDLVQEDDQKACSLILEMIKGGYSNAYILMSNAPWNPDASSKIEGYAWRIVQATATGNSGDNLITLLEKNMSPDELVTAKVRANDYVQKYLKNGTPVCTPNTLKPATVPLGTNH